MNKLQLKHTPRQVMINLFKFLFLLCCCMVLIFDKKHQFAPLVGILLLSIPIYLLIDFYKCSIVKTNRVSFDDTEIDISLSFIQRTYKWDELLYVGVKSIGNKNYLTFDHVDDYLHQMTAGLKDKLLYLNKSIRIPTSKLDDASIQEIILKHQKNQNPEVINQLLLNAKLKRQNT